MNVEMQSYGLGIMVKGDDTVGWVLGCLGEFNKEGTSPIPPVDIISTHGTGNDFSRILVG
ncbi:BnaA03g51660D [Brassica napus]|uniref:(rape) hypothetical protein n=1 Tax=Brassica napus TaxID=3708 RepID=A0A078FM85_BRANA|nr:unnamed protein product [Brassica napus]CDY13448.1 BnaA03g51660D [Brassica napus]